MSNPYIKVTSLTQATKGKHLLMQQGINASVERIQETEDATGCSYSIRVDGDKAEAIAVLKKAEFPLPVQEGGGAG